MPGMYPKLLERLMDARYVPKLLERLMDARYVP